MQTDTCQSGTCTGSNPVVCTPLDACHVAGTCDGATGQCSNPVGPDGTPCSAPNGTGSCQGGTCEPPPEVVSTTPADASQNVPVTDSVAITFSRPMAPATLTAQAEGDVCSGSIQVSTDGFTTCIGFPAPPAMSGGDTVATLVPAPGLSYGRVYRFHVSSAAQSAIGLGLAPAYTSPSGFRTGLAPGICDGKVVVSQLYGGGGNTGAPYRNDFVELHNRSSNPIDLAGWSVQYASTAGTTWNDTALTGTLPPGGYYLVQLGSGGAAGALLPAPDATGNTNMSAASGKIALVASTTPLAGACPAGAPIVDFVGYGTANCFEGGGAAPVGSNTIALARAGTACTDTDDNSADFATAAPAPRNSASPAVDCACGIATLNESDLPDEADFCMLELPLTFSVAASQATPSIQGRLREAGITDPAGGHPSVVAQVGYGPRDKNPEHEPGWQWFAAAFTTQVATDDLYAASFTAPAIPGSYSYAFRFSFDGTEWTYCDADGTGSESSFAFDTPRLGTMTVTP
jgi:hypothetical protein